METRKLMLHGQSSLTISIPNKWIKKNGLQKGGTVIIYPLNEGLFITRGNTVTQMSANLNITGKSRSSIMSLITKIYRKGYTEVNVAFNTSDEYATLSGCLQNLIGFAIVKNSKGSCFIEDLSNEMVNIDNIVRRIMLMILQQFEDLKENTDHSNFYMRDADINKLVNLALRMISKGKVENRYREFELFHILLLLEEIGDDISKMTILEKINKKTVQDISNLFRMLYETYFEKKHPLAKYYEKYYIYWPDENIPLSESTKKLLTSGFYIRQMTEKIISLAELICED